jgi:hypothetical protein
MMDVVTGSASSPYIHGIPVFEVVGERDAHLVRRAMPSRLRLAWVCQVAPPRPRHVGVQRFMLHTVLHE